MLANTLPSRDRIDSKMMSYTDNVFGLSTLAHELGHSMHSYHTWRNQPAIHTNYALFVVEVTFGVLSDMVDRLETLAAK